MDPFHHLPAGAGQPSHSRPRTSSAPYSAPSTSLQTAEQFVPVCMPMNAVQIGRPTLAVMPDASYYTDLGAGQLSSLAGSAGWDDQNAGILTSAPPCSHPAWPASTFPFEYPATLSQQPVGTAAGDFDSLLGTDLSTRHPTFTQRSSRSFSSPIVPGATVAEGAINDDSALQGPYQGLPMMDYMYASPAPSAVAQGEHAASLQEQFSLRPRATSATPSRAMDTMQSTTGLTAQPSAQYPYAGPFVAYESDLPSQALDAGIPVAAPYQFGDAMPGFPTTSDFAAYPGTVASHEPSLLGDASPRTVASASGSPERTFLRRKSSQRVDDTGSYTNSPLLAGQTTPTVSSADESERGRTAASSSSSSRAKPQCWDHGCNGRQFSTFSNLLRHQREKSGAAAKAYCPYCRAKFTRTTARNGHLAHEKCKARRSS